MERKPKPRDEEERVKDEFRKGFEKISLKRTINSFGFLMSFIGMNGVYCCVSHMFLKIILDVTEKVRTLFSSLCM
jgi:hypothetical protein